MGLSFRPSQQFPSSFRCIEICSLHQSRPRSRSQFLSILIYFGSHTSSNSSSPFCCLCYSFFLFFSFFSPIPVAMALPPAGTYIDMSGGGLYDEKQQLLATVASSIRYLEEGCRCCLREGLRNPSPINQSILIQYLEYRNFRILNKRALVLGCR